MESNKHYLGDIKWVLYQYIYDMNSSNIIIRCGNYAFNKLQSMPGFKESYNHYILNLNGEGADVIHVPELERKQLIISKFKGENFTVDLILTIFKDDIILYFA